MFALVWAARVLFVIVCWSGAFADMYPSSEARPTNHPAADNAPHDQLAVAKADPARPDHVALTHNQRAPGSVSLQDSELLNVASSAAFSSDVGAKWTELRSRIRADENVLAACGSDLNLCPPAARRFLSIIELGENYHGLARLGWINRAVNLAIRPMSDWAQYGYADFWASPLQTLSSRAGDCEDYAIVKYVALAHLGIAAADRQVVIVYDRLRQAQHAIVVVRYETRWLILDNRTMVIADTQQAKHYYPLISMDDRGLRTFSVVQNRH